tara:strand:+ start:574 stop:735 length:162 start_codon:yes stop_codon:yes gene_type:complete
LKRRTNKSSSIQKIQGVELKNYADIFIASQAIALNEGISVELMRGKSFYFFFG